VYTVSLRTPQLWNVWFPAICGHPRICLFCLKCTKFGQLIPKNIVKVVATRCQILGPNARNLILAGSTQTPLGKLTPLPDPLAVFQGPTSEGREERLLLMFDLLVAANDLLGRLAILHQSSD